ncbi:hypothetical protein OJF2_78110 [Aquisphaera giovannonii]|uniref:Uncharacterized protein n=1 Tax=Aquisphaera giovannonii TaxID=406548 RepID=A0A5B9WFZ6_9BACT|nr:hypothetical protein [Aquisphaera giovannonii]QEH39199.1 hypothetical protein OJF2_78110 [Aquisphaera giovannonii]
MPPGDTAADLAALDAKINALLPARYQHCYETVPPTSMGSAGLSYDEQGKVAWDRIWTTFCDLALAGGPPHRGRLLEPVPEADVAAQPTRYAEVVAELRRALWLTSALVVGDGYAPGWVGVRCTTAEEAAWLQLAVTAENVSARRRGAALQLPAGPSFRVEKEIKNVVVALIKACHYWEGHLTGAQQTLGGDDAWEAAGPTEAAATPAEYEAAMAEMEESLRPAGLPIAPRAYAGWVGVRTSGEEEAVWLLRAVLVERILARREDHVLYFPVAASPDADRAARVGRLFARSRELWTAYSSRRPAWRPSGRT